MGRFIILLIIFGAIYIYVNQEDLLNKMNQYIKIDRVIYQINKQNKEIRTFDELIFNK